MATGERVLTRRVIFMTLCGCYRVVEVEHGATAHHVPLEQAFPAWSADDAASAAPAFTARVFQPSGRYEIFGEERLEVWKERAGEALGQVPEVSRRFTEGEWADHVERVRAAADGIMSSDDAAFLEAHRMVQTGRGGHLLGSPDSIHHERGALVGVLYIAPGWGAARDFLGLMSDLRRALETRELGWGEP